MTFGGPLWPKPFYDSMTDYLPVGGHSYTYHIPSLNQRLGKLCYLQSCGVQKTQLTVFLQPKLPCAVLPERTVDDGLLSANSVTWEWTLSWSDCGAPCLSWQGARSACIWVCLHFCHVFAWIPLSVSSLNGRIKTQHKVVSFNTVYSKGKRIPFSHYLHGFRLKDDLSHRAATDHF